MIIDMKKLMEQLNDIDVSSDINEGGFDSKFQALHNDLEKLINLAYVEKFDRPVSFEDLLGELESIVAKYDKYKSQ